MLKIVNTVSGEIVARIWVDSLDAMGNLDIATRFIESLNAEHGTYAIVITRR